MQVGQFVLKRGFFTKALFVRSQPTSELERRLGYRTGRLAQGWTLLFLEDLPNPNEFEFRGYSHLSGGVAQGHLPKPPDPRNSEQRLRDDKFDVARMKQDIIRNTFRLSGPDRLAKVIPASSEFGENDCPPGSGIPQWTLTRDKRFRVAAVVPAGGMYLGNYL